MGMRLIVKDGKVDEAGSYLEHSYHADLNEAYVLLEKLKDTKNSLHFQSQCFCLDFSYLGDTSFQVEIFDIRDGFWAISEIDMVVARRIVEMVSENEKFRELIPITNELWGAYGGGQFA
jgi:hypothetical protein